MRPGAAGRAPATALISAAHALTCATRSSSVAPLVSGWGSETFTAAIVWPRDPSTGAAMPRRPSESSWSLTA
jgi:hypothetical protein